MLVKFHEHTAAQPGFYFGKAHSDETFNTVLLVIKLEVNTLQLIIARAYVS